MAPATAESLPKRTRAKDGQKAEGGRALPAAIVTPQPQTPLDFALGIMRNDSKPDSLRVTMAKAAMPYLHKRGEAQERAEDETAQEEPISDFELARRIAHILGLGEAEGMRELERARETARIANDKARAAEARARAMEKRTLAAAQDTAHRPRATETTIADKKQSGHGEHESDLLRPGDAEVRAELAIAQEKANAAEARARIAEAHAREMEQRALAVEELIATRRETRGRF